VRRHTSSKIVRNRLRRTSVVEGMAGAHWRMDRMDACLDDVPKRLGLIET